MALQTSERYLIEAAQAGDLLAFEALARRHEALVYRVALRMLNRPADAEDATQDVLLQAWRALPRFRSESSLPTWLYRLTTNRCHNVLRSLRPSEPLAAELASGQTTELEVEQALRLDAVKAAVVRLTPQQRAPFVLREFEGLSYVEIAEVLETTVPAIKSRLHRARAELVSALSECR
ncbi:MAG: sigma-70 family RNA polymerase sigma factor [Actinobacteria bacterium]|nr:sigma-70 family RNA polymerase sigma factor [Actinomycetota bacterium]